MRARPSGMRGVMTRRGLCLCGGVVSGAVVVVVPGSYSCAMALSTALVVAAATAIPNPAWTTDLSLPQECLALSWAIALFFFMVAADGEVVCKRRVRRCGEIGGVLTLLHAASNARRCFLAEPWLDKHRAKPSAEMDLDKLTLGVLRAVRAVRVVGDLVGVLEGAPFNLESRSRASASFCNCASPPMRSNWSG